MLKRIASYFNRPHRAAHLFMLPAGILLVMFTLLPLLGTLVMSFFDMNIFFNDTQFVGVDNFVRFFGDSRAINSLWHTLYFCLWQVPLQIAVGLVLAFALTRNNIFNKLCRSIFFVPTVCSLVSISIIWKMLLDPNIGTVPYLLRLVGADAPNFLGNAAFALPTVALITVWKNFGMTLMILLGGIQGISPSLYESAQIDGANRRQQFFRITIPQIIPSLSFCLLTNFIGSMQVYDQIKLLTNGGPQFKTESAVMYIYTRGFTAPYELGYASAISWVLFLIIAAITIVMNLYMNRKEQQYG